MPKVADGDATYIVLPRTKLQRVKALAALRGQTMRVFFAQAVDRELAAGGGAVRSNARSRKQRPRV